MIFKKSVHENFNWQIAISFFSSKDADEECAMRSKGDNTEIMVNDKANKVVEDIKLG